MLRDWGCECGRRACRERVYLTISEYRQAAELGLVVSVNHAVTRRTVTRRRTYVVVEAGKALA